MKDKPFDIVGLGSCGIDHITQVHTFADKDNKVTADNIEAYGGGLTANNLVQTARLGLKAAWCGALGKDIFAAQLTEMFAQEGITCSAYTFEKTQFTWIIVDAQGERQIYIFPNSTVLLTTNIVEKKFRTYIEHSKHFHTEVAVIPLVAAIAGAQIAKNAGSKVFLDIDGDVECLLQEAKIGTREELQQLIQLSDVIKLSESAAKQFAGNKRINEIVQELLQSAEIVAVTLGEKGCIIANRKETLNCSAYNVSVVDGTGAGDAFMGGLSYAILQGWDLRKVGMFASACGAYSCTQLGARGSGTLAEINRLMIR
ncbi:MAG TPA: carbohydrate kinase family protein [Candidatus Nanoarchaeia archaeon]|nr:carbohydrate kinase family protein [Candidatus Nanoarchaeia archaeon]